MLSKIIKISIIILTFVFIAYYGLYYTQEFNKYLNYRKSGIVRSTIIGPDSNLVFSQVDTADFLSRPFPKINDRILTVNDTAATLKVLSRYFDSPNRAGTEIYITYLANQNTIKALVRTRPLSNGELLAQGVLMLMRFLISICYLAVGLWAFAKRPNSGAVRALTLFCYAMGGFLMTVITMISANFISYKLPALEILSKIISNLVLFLGAFWINLQLLFPVPRQIVKKHPVITYSLCYLPLIILMIAMAIFKNQALAYVLIGIVSLQIIIGFAMLRRFHSKTKEPLEKRQTRLVLWGTGVGLNLLGIFVVLALVASGWMQRWPEYYLMGVLIVIFLGLLLSPLSFAYAFGKYRLLEIEGRIRRGTQHFLIGVALLGIFYLLVYYISNFTLDILGIESRTPVLISALVLAIGFAPAQRKLLGQLDRRIYPERFRLKGMLNNFLTQSSTTSDRKIFWDGLENRLKTALKVDTIYPIIRASGNGHFVLWNGISTPFEKDSAFITAIAEMGGRPIMRDELEADKKTTFTESEADWFIKNHIALILPLVTHLELIGFLCIGLKSERQDFEPTDFEILRSLSNQIAIAADNILLIEENVEKKRMEAELTIARQVQEKMLPGDIPDTPALEIAAMSKFCTEVAGDYYDIIDVGDGRTVLAIGDVSGKGAAAALLMSNVQASLRTAIGIESQMDIGKNSPLNRDIQLSGIVANINRLIFHNSQPEQFITFFVAIFDPKTNRLDYINAGHNPPLAVSQSGLIKELTEGGLLLGVMPEMPYQQGSIQLSVGDIVFLYTDGLSESTRADEEMFGEERIKQFLAANSGLAPKILLEKLENEVSIFIGDQHLADDFTLLSAKVK
jgi:serine phosphatase RsbU (regulator of sigma subunit)